MQHPENKKEIAKIIGLNLRKLRGALYQHQFSKIIGIHHQQISRYESGKAVPNNKTLKKIAQALGVTISQLANVENKQEYDNSMENLDEQMLINKLKIECKNLSLSDRQLVEDFIKILERDDPKMRHILQTTMRAILEAMGSKTEN
jgi:transcriptional regulator with XRE-family HTH domain